MDIADVFGGVPVHELIVLILSYVTECEAVRLCHEWHLSDEMKAVAWPGCASLRSLEEICANIAHAGDVELKWARKNGCEWDAATCSSAAGNGHLNVLQWARANSCQWSIWTCHNAAVNGMQLRVAAQLRCHIWTY